MASRFLVPLFAVVAATALCPQSNAATHYFLIQGNFDTSTAAAETFKWVVDDPNNVLQSGQDVMNAIFGTMSTVSGPVSTVGAGFQIDATYYGTFNPPSYFFETFTLLGLPGTADDKALEYNFDDGLGWNYYNKGGSYAGAFDAPHSDIYPDGELSGWTSGRVGTTGRSLLENGVAETTFDAWVFGGDGFGAPKATIQGSENDPTVANFTGSNTLIQQYVNGVSVYSYSAVPEPQRALLLLAGISSMLTVRRRKRASNHLR